MHPSFATMTDEEVQEGFRAFAAEKELREMKKRETLIDNFKKAYEDLISAGYQINYHEETFECESDVPIIDFDEFSFI